MVAFLQHANGRGKLRLKRSIKFSKNYIIEIHQFCKIIVPETLKQISIEPNSQSKDGVKSQ